MKKIIFLLLVYLFLGIVNVYSVTIDDLIINSDNKKISFIITDRKETILNKFRNNKIIKKQSNNSCDQYLVDDMDIMFLGEKVISIILQSKKYYLSTGVKIGDNINCVYKKYNSPGYNGKFANGDCFIDYYVNIKTDSPWKEPMYTLRFIYCDEEIKKISIFYTE